MGIRLDLVDTQPEINRNRVFLTRMHIEQVMSSDENRPPTYYVHLEWRRYGVDQMGRRHFAPHAEEVTFKDYLSHAIAEANQGDLRHVHALEAIEEALAGIIADELNTASEIV